MRQLKQVLLKWYRNINFRQKIYMVCILAGLIPVLVLGVFCYLQIDNLLVNREKQAEQDTLKQAAIVFQNKLDTYRNTVSNVAWNNSIRQAVTRNYTNNYEMYLAYRDEVDPPLAAISMLNGDISSETLYISRNLYPHGNTVKTLEDAKKEPWYQTAVHARKPSFYISREKEDMAVCCPIFSSSLKSENYIAFDLNYKGIFSQFNTLFDNNFGVLLLDKHGTILYSYQNFRNQIPEKQIQAFAKDKKLPKNYISMGNVLTEEGWTLFLYRPMSTIWKNIAPILLMVVLVVLGCAFLLNLLTRNLSYVIVRPLETLTRNMKLIGSKGLFVDLPPDEPCNDEIGVLAKQFRIMVRKLQRLVDEIYKTNIEKQKYEIKALQAQINPHFFYNSLSLINSKALVSGQEDISEMAQLLSTYYRTTLNRGNSEISVEDEWKNTVSYIKIQIMMHSRSFQFVETLDPSVLNYKMPNLILQPLAENAIIHGIDQRTMPGPGLLEISCKVINDQIEFIVKDNGCGIAPDKLKNILTAKSNGYGIKNIQRRIQLYFGKSFGLTFASTENKGTTVTLRIPAQETLTNISGFEQISP
ncbi:MULTISPECIES: cache domain-containing sensor histidine kinase [Caproicibacterium]|jgi:two-component system sensor histidine kinase YesM|uniref:histidine kinase n=1 Tax=Caproicibacterium lactatifermentans TaxID=2666138 RepID=A0ABX6PTZ9_9FIRM|nr:sensor histidine kinase [Caproicibacterium lactatifermentans]QKO29704.1 HAMP domain-containing protein [Caproicibacterium lactatifermentans]